LPHTFYPTTQSGIEQQSVVEIKDNDGENRADVTQAGLTVDVNNISLIGSSTYTQIDATQRRLDTTSLVGTKGYPMDIELEAQYAPWWVYQGGSTVTLPTGHLTRIREDDWRLVTVSRVGDAYFAVLREATASTASGLLVATRID
jgi:hypothetical protein